jgi:hypothetical protein
MEEIQVGWPTHLRDYVVIRSELIQDSREARRYYEERLCKLHRLMCHGREVEVLFDKSVNHCYTEEPPDDPSGVTILVSRLGGGIVEKRAFCLDRAVLMDAICPAICKPSYSLAGEAPKNRPRFLLHGPPLPGGRYLRVVLRWDGRQWNCMSAYPISADKWKAGWKSIRKFPP